MQTKPEEIDITGWYQVPEKSIKPTHSSKQRARAETIPHMFINRMDTKHERVSLAINPAFCTHKTWLILFPHLCSVVVRVKVWPYTVSKSSDYQFVKAKQSSKLNERTVVQMRLIKRAFS